MKKVVLILTILTNIVFVSCHSDDDSGEKGVVAPPSYVYERDGESTVDYSGQITRLDMHSQLKSAVSSANTSGDITLTKLQAMFDHQEGNLDFEDGIVFTAAELNASSKQIKSKTGAKVSYQSDVQDYFVDWFTEVVANKNPSTMASQGAAGYMDRTTDGSKRILVDAGGFEYTQVISKGLMGALELDQMVNNYLSDAQLDVENNTNEEGKDYTKMEHHWDEAFGYVSLDLNALSLSEPASDATDRFWGEYIYSVDGTIAGEGIKDRIMTAFLTGRQAIHVKNYEVRDEQATILKQELSLVCALKAVNYLLGGRANALAVDPQDKANAFHALAEGHGFIYALQFTNDGTDTPYFSRSEVENMLATLEGNGGLYNSNIETVIDNLANQIATKFGFTASDAL